MRRRGSQGQGRRHRHARRASVDRRHDRGPCADRARRGPSAARRDLSRHRPDTTARTHTRHRRRSAGPALPPPAGDHTPRHRGLAAADDPLLVVTADNGSDGRPFELRELATHQLVVPPATTDCGQAILHACQQVGFTPTTRYITTDIASQITLARSGLATALVPRTAIDPTTPGIRTAPIEDHPTQRLLFAATRHTETTNPTTAAVIAALGTAAQQDHITFSSEPKLTPCRGQALQERA
ncbi:LysR family transcriptional regulator substrate-binding protein [Streptomyces sp. NPDC058637]|uniref:LysR family transcriptional regulator substrate-binding protein n=1 Tax=Streptomyces sp. NPDC058637 TaxID=3346569 RepID=UPI00365F0438